MADQKAETSELLTIRLPVWWTFGGLVAGLFAGLALAGTATLEPVLAVTEPAGTLWLRALQMTIIPLVASLLVIGIAQMVRAARAGRAARRMLGWVFAVLVFSGLVSAVFMPLLLGVFPIPAAASTLLETGDVATQQVPELGEFVTSLIAPNVIEAAAETTMLPLTIFFALFAVAVARLPESQRDVLLGVFRALANAMLTIIGWVLWIAPLGVFALALGVASRAGGGAFATLVHYILVVAAMGGIVLVAAYLVAWLAGGISPLRFARGMIPAQAVAISTQSSLASLPAMLQNMAVAIYVATLAGVELTPAVLAAGIAVALVISVGSVSLPGSISFVISIGPIALAMGVPVEPLALLVAVEMLPDIMRTLANVTMNVAVTAATDRTDDETV